MNRGTLSSLIALAWLASGTLGCTSGPSESDGDASSAAAAYEAAPTPPAMFAFTADNYDAAFDAAVRELRDAGFRIARNDRRFGVITTWPKESPTAFEPWVGDNTTGDLARRSTLNHLRRAVTVTLEPTFDLDEALSGTNSGGPARPEHHSTYTLTVTVTLEREQRPNRYMTHSARGSIASSYDSVPAHLAQQGIPASYWEPAGNDPHLATHLLGVIRERSGSTFTPQYDDEDIIQADDD